MKEKKRAKVIFFALFLSPDKFKEYFVIFGFEYILKTQTLTHILKKYLSFFYFTNFSFFRKLKKILIQNLNQN